MTTPNSPNPAAFLEDLIDACVMESGESMKYEGRVMKCGGISGVFNLQPFFPSSASAPTAPTY